MTGQFHQKHDLLRVIQPALDSISGRERKIEAQLEKEPIRYLVAGAHITADSAAGATSIEVSTIPKWCLALPIYIAFDAGTDECEVRRITSISENTVSFAGALSYAHAEGDPVIYSEEAMVDVKWFGAKGDNATDDTTAFNRANTQFGILGAGYLFIPPGIYLVGTTVTMSSNTQVRGLGMQGSQVRFTGANRFIYAHDVDNVLIRDLRITITGARDCIEFDNVSNGEVRDVFLEGNVSDLNTREIGIKITTTCEYIGIFDCYFYKLHKGVYSNGTNYLKIVTCLFRDFLYFTNSGGYEAQRGIHAVSSNYVQILRNVFHEIAWNNGTDYVYGYPVYVDTCTYVACDGNNSYLAGDGHFYFIHCTDITVDGNTYYGSGASGYNGWGIYLHGITRAAVMGNISRLNYVAGIYWNECIDLMLGGNVGTETPVDGLGYSGSAVDRVKRSYLYTEWIPAQDFDTQIGASYPVLSSIGAANDDPYAWIWTGYIGYLFVWWRVPSNFIGTTFNVRLRVYWTAEGAGISNMYAAITEGKNGASLVGATGSSSVAVPAFTGAYQLHITDKLSVTVDGASALRIEVGFQGGMTDDIWLLGVEVLLE